MNFKKWLFEVGMGGGVGGGLEPPKQNPTSMTGSYSDYHSNSNDSKDPNGQLPPVVKKKPCKSKLK